MRGPSWSPGEGKLKASRKRRCRELFYPFTPTAGCWRWDDERVVGGVSELLPPTSWGQPNPQGKGTGEGSTAMGQACPNPGAPIHMETGRAHGRQGIRKLI